MRAPCSVEWSDCGTSPTIYCAAPRHDALFILHWWAYVTRLYALLFFGSSFQLSKGRKHQPATFLDGIFYSPLSQLRLRTHNFAWFKFSYRESAFLAFSSAKSCFSLRQKRRFFCLSPLSMIPLKSNQVCASPASRASSCWGGRPPSYGYVLGIHLLGVLWLITYCKHLILWSRTLNKCIISICTKNIITYISFGDEPFFVKEY